VSCVQFECGNPDCDEWGPGGFGGVHAPVCPKCGSKKILLECDEHTPMAHLIPGCQAFPPGILGPGSS